MPLAQLTLLSLVLYTTAIPRENFYPFGEDVGDSKVDHSATFTLGDDRFEVSLNIKLSGACTSEL